MKNAKQKQQQMKRAYKNGFTPLEVAHMKEIARKQAEKLEKEATEKAFVDMLAVPCAVLAYDYWQKSAKKRIPEFIKEVVSLYESIQVGAVTREEIVETFEELAGVKLEAEWYKLRNEEGENNEGSN